jgi:DNA-binding Xre family transcriptional regulator
MALDYRWRLRELMAARGIFTAGELGPHLAAHGVRLSDSQVWRLVTGRPERLNLRVLVVLCAILDCTPDDLIERIEVEQTKKHAAVGRAASTDVVPKRARIRRPDDA